VQATQAAHAALAFALEYPVAPGNYLVLLEAPDVLDLCWLLSDAERGALRAVAFYEPDLGDELTAVALEGAGAKLCRKFSLLFSKGGEKDDCHDGT
jgi:hypothetical protein